MLKTVDQRVGGVSAATVAAARAPFVEVALHQAARLDTLKASTLAGRMMAGIDNLEPEVFYALSSEMEFLFRCSPHAKAEARAMAERAAREERERRRAEDRAALGVGARAQEGRTWL